MPFSNVASRHSNSSGKVYAEVLIEAVGAGDFGAVAIGLTQSIIESGGISVMDQGFAIDLYDRTIYKFSTVEATPGGAAIVPGDVLQFAIDIALQVAWVGVNGTWLQGNPATGADPIVTGLDGTVYFVCASAFSGFSVRATLQIYADQFSFTVPSGFTPWSP